MTEAINYNLYMLRIYEILREDEKTQLLSPKEKNALADALVLNERKEPTLQILGQLYMRLEFWNRPADDEIIKGGMKPAVRKLYEDLKQDKKITSSLKLLSGVEGFRPMTWSDALYGNQMTEDEGFIGGGYVTFDPSEKYKSMKEKAAIPDNEIVKNAKSSFGKMFQIGCLTFFLVMLFTILLGVGIKLLMR